MTPPGALEPLRWWQLEPVVALEREVFGPGSWSAETFWSELAQVGSRHYVAAWDDGALLGYAGAAATREDGWVQTIAVAPAARGRGLGDALLTDLEDAARDRGAPTMSLEVRADNEVAQHLYARHGYALHGRRRRYYEPEGVDALVLVRALS